MTTLIYCSFLNNAVGVNRLPTVPTKWYACYIVTSIHGWLLRSSSKTSNKCNTEPTWYDFLLFSTTSGTAAQCNTKPCGDGCRKLSAAATCDWGQHGTKYTWFAVTQNPCEIHPSQTRNQVTWFNITLRDCEKCFNGTNNALKFTPKTTILTKTKYTYQ